MTPCNDFDAGRRHSAVCTDYRECDGGTGCICRPPEDVAPPSVYELWWCAYCGEPSSEASDPCQECGEPIVRRTYVAALPGTEAPK